MARLCHSLVPTYDVRGWLVGIFAANNKKREQERCCSSLLRLVQYPEPLADLVVGVC